MLFHYTFFLFFLVVSGEVTVDTTENNYVSIPYNTKEISGFTFKVKGPNDAFIGLFVRNASNIEGKPLYEVIIGGWGNKRCGLETGKIFIFFHQLRKLLMVLCTYNDHTNYR